MRRTESIEVLILEASDKKNKPQGQMANRGEKKCDKIYALQRKNCHSIGAEEVIWWHILSEW